MSARFFVVVVLFVCLFVCFSFAGWFIMVYSLTGRWVQSFVLFQQLRISLMYTVISTLARSRLFGCTFFNNRIVPTEFLPWGVRVAFPQGKPAATESRYPTYGACWMFKCFHNPPNSDMDYRFFIVRGDVNACDFSRGSTDTERETALKVDSGRKIPCRTGESNLRRRRDSPML